MELPEDSCSLAKHAQVTEVRGRRTGGDDIDEEGLTVRTLLALKTAGHRFTTR